MARALPTGVLRGTALLVPGFTGSKEDFYPVLPMLAERGYATYAYSQRGQADSAGPREESSSAYRLADFVGDLLFVRRALGKAVHLLGHSFGGVIAEAAAICEPSEFADLTMLCSGPRGWVGRTAQLPAVLRGSTVGLPLW